MNGLIGCGEVGSAIEELYIGIYNKPEYLAVRDPSLQRTDPLGTCPVIHVCVPASVVESCILGSESPKEALYILHSTVAPGTCRKLSIQGRHVVHAPVEGRHPNLAEALEDWQMPVSGPREDVYGALEVLRALGIPADPWVGAWESTELAKHMSTLRLGVDVLFMRHCYELAVKLGADPELVYDRYTRNYNNLYAQDGGPGFVRPRLKPVEGPIGGHCVGSNAEAIKDLSWFAAEVAATARKDWKRPEGGK